MVERILFFNVTFNEYEQFKNESKVGKTAVPEIIKTSASLPAFIVNPTDVTYTDANCAMCGLQIKYDPIFSFKTATRRNGKFEIDLAFHGLGCYRNFINLRNGIKDNEKMAIYNSVKVFYYPGRPVKSMIPPLPDPVYALKSYGRGSYTDEQYIELIAEHNKGIFIE